MNHLNQFRLILTKDKNPKYDRVTIRAEVPDSPHKYIWFVFFGNEFERAVNDGGMFADGYHKVEVAWGRWLFFDLEHPYERTGQVPLRYVSVNIPRFIGRLFLRIANNRFKTLQPEEKWEWEIPQETRDRWCRIYGQGTGRVAWVFPNEEAEKKAYALFESPTGRRSVGTLYAIASNQTYTVHDRAYVHLSPDWDGWYFVVKSPRGLTALNGGVINHGRDDEANWSIHT